MMRIISAVRITILGDVNSDSGRDISVSQLTVQQLAGFFIEGM